LEKKDEADAEVLLENNRMNPMGDDQGDLVNLTAESIRVC